MIIVLLLVIAIGVLLQSTVGKLVLATAATPFLLLIAIAYYLFLAALAVGVIFFSIYIFGLLGVMLWERMDLATF